ncbi:citrate lyase subunit beta, partial [Kutzneria sp. 744]
HCPGHRLRRHPAVDPGQQPRLTVGSRRPDHAGHGGRRQAGRDHGAEGGGRRGHPLRRPAAGQLEAKASLTRPILVHAILETARGVANVEEIAGASPRMQGLSLGPADLAASRRMKTTRVGGGHPGYLVRTDPTGDDLTAGRQTFQQDLWHYTVARMVDACAAHGILPFYGPFGDIRDVVACEDQFRNAFLLGCVGAWSLHPVQIEIARRVFSPSPDEVSWARKVIAAMGDGTGAVMIDGKMQDDATVKQCRVVAELADALAARDPELAKAYAEASDD